MMKKLLTALATTLALTGAFAHSDAKPKHGGIVQAASELSFELVIQPDGAAIYVEDHGKPIAPQGMGGKLTVLNGAEKSEAALTPAGDKLEAKGLKLQPGAKAVAAVTTAGNKTITVRFSVK
jgi:hypothetical protein